MKIRNEGNVLIVHFGGNRKKMNEVLDVLSNSYEGIIKGREGHNFPSSYIVKDHVLYPYKSKCKYVIGVYNGKSIKHELLHAKYYMDSEYRSRIEREWNEMEERKREYIKLFLQRLGYQECVWIDEYQAYRYTEAPNFFGIQL